MVVLPDCIADNLSYKPRKDLEIYETKKIESTFVEVINKTGKNIIIGCIYKHHTISPKDFTKTMTPFFIKII